MTIRTYFEAEMRLLHEAAQTFAENNPLLANKLNLRELKDKDPHVERLLEGFAFLTAQLRQQMDTYTSDINEALLAMVCPNLLQPYPAATIMQFTGQYQLTKPKKITKATLVNSEHRGEEKTPCYFRTTSSVVVNPLLISEIFLQDRTLCLKFNTINAATCTDLDLQEVILYINASDVSALELYWMLTKQIAKINVSFSANKPITVNLGGQELLESYYFNCLDQINLALLQDYFHFRERFLFVKLRGLDKINWSDNCQEFTLEIFSNTTFSEEIALTKQTFLLHCVPAVNLYEKSSEPILLTANRYEYPLILDLVHRNNICLYEINEVMGLSTDHRQSPFFPLTDTSSLQQENVYKIVTRSLGSLFPQTYVHIINAKYLAEQILSCKVTVCNGYYPRQCLQENTLTKLAADLSAWVKVKNLLRPSPFLPAPAQQDHQWQLMHYLRQQYSSLIDLNNLQQLLQLCDWTKQDKNKRRILAIKSVSAKMLNEMHRGMLMHGLELSLTMQEEGFNSHYDIFLFGQVLHEFFSTQIALNSFIQTKVVCLPTQREFLWQPKYGQKLMI